ncbi:MAG: hypothetical protein OXC46_03395 [Thaumarchaeota archaeon]|nr:hypothetical protein [Nitrososphaerota archaeon]
MKEYTNIKLLFQLARYPPKELKNKKCVIYLLCLDVHMMSRLYQYVDRLLSQEQFKFTSDVKGMIISHDTGSGKTIIEPTFRVSQDEYSDISDNVMVVTYLALGKGYATNWKWGQFNDCTAEEWNNDLQIL